VCIISILFVGWVTKRPGDRSLGQFVTNTTHFTNWYGFDRFKLQYGYALQWICNHHEMNHAYGDSLELK
jgi:hypothetical protein